MTISFKTRATLFALCAACTLFTAIPAMMIPSVA